MRALVCVAIAIGAGACSVPRPPNTPIARAQRTHEYPSPPVHQTAAGLPTPADAIAVFATAYMNWTAADVTGRMRALARLSIGQARSAVLLAAAQTAQDYELRRAGIANSGTVEAVAPLLHSNDRYVVVTRERTTASNTTAYQGLAPAWHLALATVSRVASGAWAVSSWRPEN
ncbi:MAG: hypothetical protein ACLPV4_19935 [Solirubrobacteraceae bacterium]